MTKILAYFAGLAAYGALSTYHVSSTPDFLVGLGTGAVAALFVWLGYELIRED